jgi:3'(2'), 5'-bisphosphate nucleotidase
VPYEVRRRWDCFWLVDPLDGTREFVKRNNEFTVNIALIEAGRPVLGLVYAPVFALLYAGARGFGAWKIEGLAPETRAGAFPSWEDLTARGRRLRPAGAGGGKKRVVLVGSRSHQSKAFLTYVEELRRSEPGAQMFVSGSALKFCYVAEGRATIYPGFGRTMEWDTAAGQAILNQVGKSVRSFAQGRAGEELVYNKKDLRTGPFIAR